MTGGREKNGLMDIKIKHGTEVRRSHSEAKLNVCRITITYTHRKELRYWNLERNAYLDGIDRGGLA
jgi:hypothetical protein